MRSVRGALASVGIATAGVGLLFAYRPSLAGGLSVPRVALTVLGAIAFVEGVRSVRARRRAEIDGAAPPPVEERAGTPMPGREFDRLVRSPRAGERVRRRLREAAVETLATRRDLDRETAEARVDAGSWTDDTVAAAFLGGAEAPTPPLRTRLRLAYGGASLRVEVERTVAAIAALLEGS